MITSKKKSKETIVPVKSQELKPGRKDSIVNVWKDNFTEEIDNITALLEKFPCLTIVRKKHEYRIGH